MNSEPLVSVITPVYNTEKYLAECIESILAQTYKNWEYIIVNNCSSDKSPEIAESYARKESRIKIHHNEKFLNIIPNWNHALNQVSRQSEYCKFVHADDWLFPKCIEQMVEIAEANPRVGIVGSYRLDETKVNPDGLPYPQKVFPGREICRRALLNGDYFFGSPTTLLLRSNLVRANKPFYNEEYIHADNEVCFRILKSSDWGFVFQVLSYTRRHNETNTMFTRRMNTFVLENLLMLNYFGPTYLSDIEFKKRFKYILKNYYRFLGRSLLQKRNKEFWHYHRDGLKRINHSMSRLRLLCSACIIIYNKGLERLKIKI